MPRVMKDSGDAFRAAITTTTTHPDGRVTLHTAYEGPYATVGAARSRITSAERWVERQTSWQRHYPPETRTTVTVSAHVEKSATTWEPVP